MNGRTIAELIARDRTSIDEGETSVAVQGDEATSSIRQDDVACEHRRSPECIRASQLTSSLRFATENGLIRGFLRLLSSEQPHGSRAIRTASQGSKVLRRLYYGACRTVPTPSPAEQQKIADCLTSLDEVIAAQGRKVAALTAHKTGADAAALPPRRRNPPPPPLPRVPRGCTWSESRHWNDLGELVARRATYRP